MKFFKIECNKEIYCINLNLVEKVAKEESIYIKFYMADVVYHCNCQDNINRNLKWDILMDKLGLRI